MGIRLGAFFRQGGERDVELPYASNGFEPCDRHHQQISRRSEVRDVVSMNTAATTTDRGRYCR